jgi:hypothetical protein
MADSPGVENASALPGPDGRFLCFFFAAVARSW